MSSSFSQRRRERLLPGGIPRYVRCYDNEDRSADRYTVVFTGRAAKMRGRGAIPDQWPYLAMSASPFHPQGVGMHGHTDSQPADTIRDKPGWHWPPALGRKNHLGKRIRFADLPEDCRRLVLQDYLAIWELNEI